MEALETRNTENEEGKSPRGCTLERNSGNDGVCAAEGRMIQTSEPITRELTHFSNGSWTKDAWKMRMLRLRPPKRTFLGIYLNPSRSRSLSFPHHRLDSTVFIDEKRNRTKKQHNLEWPAALSQLLAGLAVRWIGSLPSSAVRESATAFHPVTLLAIRLPQKV